MHAQQKKLFNYGNRAKKYYLKILFKLHEFGSLALPYL